eukprot:GEMP01059711.1.p1 GENE.GEMP01059711.1~~GEMP01059711.1.p1  ORF type:complete len:320 (+),score=69.47 GEMP01059711.1:78-1037(+)
MSAGRSPNADKLGFKDLNGRVALITGASRGIGREVALALAREGCNIVVAAKSIEAQPNLPGTIFTVAKEVEALGAKALPVQVDIRDEKQCEACINKTIETFGRLDILINNASALWWHTMEKTPMKKYDLITSINTRGSFIMAKLCAPHMAKNKYGRIISMSPPIVSNYEVYKGFTAYHISKFGMTMVTLGVAAEYENDGITGNALWPATVIESQAAINFDLGEKSLWRKAQILADATVAICCDPKCTGRALIDDEYLSERGLTEEDLKIYRYDPSVEPPRMLAHKYRSGGDAGGDAAFSRGDVKKVESDRSKDMIKSKL